MRGLDDTKDLLCVTKLSFLNIVHSETSKLCPKNRIISSNKTWKADLLLSALLKEF